MSRRDPYRGRDERNELIPRHRPPTARQGARGNSWRRDSYSTRGISNANYLRAAWVITVIYFATASMLIASDVVWWKLLYWLVPLGIVVMWFWRFTIFEWIGLVRDALYRDRRLEALREGTALPPKANRPTSQEQRDNLLSSDPRPYASLGTDWCTFRDRRRPQRESSPSPRASASRLGPPNRRPTAGASQTATNHRPVTTQRHPNLAHPPARRRPKAALFRPNFEQIALWGTKSAQLWLR